MDNLCPDCNKPLMIAKSDYVFENDDNPDTPTELYSVMTMVCINSSIDPNTKKRICSLYCGTDLNNPLKIVSIVKNRIK